MPPAAVDDRTDIRAGEDVGDVPTVGGGEVEPDDDIRARAACLPPTTTT